MELTFSLVIVVVVVLAASAVVWLFHFTFSREMERMQRMVEQERLDHREQRINRERELERLMNRVMVKEWSTYTQMTQEMSSDSASEPAVGMSDEEELRRIASEQAAGGIGEAYVDLADEFEELGLGR